MKTFDDLDKLTQDLQNAICEILNEQDAKIAITSLITAFINISMANLNTKQDKINFKQILSNVLDGIIERSNP